MSRTLLRSDSLAEKSHVAIKPGGWIRGLTPNCNYEPLLDVKQSSSQMHDITSNREGDVQAFLGVHDG